MLVMQLAKQEKKKTLKMLCFLVSLLDLQVIKHLRLPHWRARENLNVGFGINFVCRFLKPFLDSEITNEMPGRLKPGLAEDGFNLGSSKTRL